jgi:predicted RNA-binding Zn-ribbon protein involved in translation (DUF1610 family)
MPTLADMQAATPICTKRVITKDGQHGVHHACGHVLRWLSRAGMWKCPACGTTAKRVQL